VEHANSRVYNMNIIPTKKITSTSEPTKLSDDERIQKLEQEVRELINIIKQMQIDIKDNYEAFEHSDDSLQNLRTIISAITAGKL
jgi:GTPase